jgi:putative membrane protein insertion efficiency factor
MQQEIQSAGRSPQPGETAYVGEFPDVETGSLPVSHIADTPPPDEKLRPDEDNCGACRNIANAASACNGKTSIAVWTAVMLIRIYQKAISPYLPNSCRFYPSCSHYAVEAFRKRGFWMGGILTLWRLLRCQPFARCGYDPVPEHGFRNQPISKQAEEQ